MESPTGYSPPRCSLTSIEGRSNHRPCPFLPSAAQRVVGLYCHKGALLARIQLTVHREPGSCPAELQPSQLTLTCAGPRGGSIPCFPTSQGFPLLSSDSSEKLSQVTEHHRNHTSLDLTHLWGRNLAHRSFIEHWWRRRRWRRRAYCTKKILCRGVL